TGGMLLDVGHAVRRTLERFNMPTAPVTAFLFAGAPEDPSGPPLEAANVMATLTELNHYADPDITFTARYGGPDGPSVETHGLPFQACYLLPMPERSSEAFRDCLSHLAAYMAHDLTTPLGTGLEQIRQQQPPPGRTPFRGFGTFGVWYPRGLLLRSAARQLCVHMIREWVGPLPPTPPPEAVAILNRILADTRLTPESLQEFIACESATSQEGNPVERIGQWVQSLAGHAESASRRPDPFSWAVATWDQTRDWIGLEPTTETDSPFRRGRLSRAFDQGVRGAVEAWQNEFTEQLRPLDDIPGTRVAATEAIYGQLMGACLAAVGTFETQLVTLAQTRQAARMDVQSALESCQNASESAGGFSLFGGRTGRSLHKFADKLRILVELRVREDLTSAMVGFYRRLRTTFEDRLRDLADTRERIAAMTDVLATPVHLSTPGISSTPGPVALADEAEEAMHMTLRGSNTIRVVLPHGEDHLDRCAAQMLTTIPREEYLRLEQALTKLVVEPRGGLVGLCKTSSDLVRSLGAPLVEQATAFLGNLLPAQDVTQVELSSAHGATADLERRITSYARAAEPLVGGPVGDERTFVVLPESAPGQQYADVVMRVLPKAKTVPVRGAGTDLLFCREQSPLRHADLARLLEPCWEAYQAALASPETNPHSRFDVDAWIPLME
ncbi:MAG: tubulin-like doman-containing protein, partial [Bacteroidales bacterium]|nr:tubulin-like doman-containing protein [Bacteroidales bacterium]